MKNVKKLAAGFLVVAAAIAIAFYSYAKNISSEDCVVVSLNSKKEECTTKEDCKALELSLETEENNLNSKDKRVAFLSYDEKKEGCPFRK